jgi:hypothetical protein
MINNALVKMKEILRIDIQYTDSAQTNYCYLTYSDCHEALHDKFRIVTDQRRPHRTSQSQIAINNRQYTNQKSMWKEHVTAKNMDSATNSYD